MYPDTVDPGVRRDDVEGDVAVLPITDEVFAANRRAAQYLASRTDIQDFPRWEIEDINTQGASAIAKTADLIGQTYDLAPDQAERLYERVIIGINPDAQGMLDEMLFGDTLNNQGDLLDFNLEEALIGTDGSEALSITISPERQRELMKDSYPADHATQTKPNDTHRMPGGWSDNSLMSEYGEDRNGETNPLFDIVKSVKINLTGSPQEVKQNLSELSKRYRAEGYSRAAENLDHFLNGKGKDRVITRHEARKDPFIAKAEEKNLRRFEEETFLGKSGRDDNNRKLLNLKDGESVKIEDDWDAVHHKWNVAGDLILQGTAGRDDALAEGRRDFSSVSSFTATRVGDKIVVKGTVDHDGSEDYDFETDGLGHLMGAKGLADIGLGHNFRTVRKWQQSFEGAIDVSAGPNGKMLSNPQIRWSDVQSVTKTP